MSKQSAFIFITRSCNLACEHCYVNSSPQLKNHMSLATFEKTLNTLESIGISDVRLTGGEPTVHPMFEDFLNHLNFRSIQPRLITNGIKLMSSKRLDSILESINSCWISVYGLTDLEHRKIGGKATKDLYSTLSFIGKLNTQFIDIGVSVLISDYNKENLDGFIDLASQLKVKKIRFIFNEPLGRSKDKRVFFNNVNKIEHIDKFILSVSKNKKFWSISINNPFDFENSNLEDSCLLRERTMYSITPDGSVYSCCFNAYNSKHKVTNIWDEDSISILSSKTQTSKFSKICQGLSPGFWSSIDNGPTCPISFIEILNNESLK